MARKRLGEILIGAGLISESQLKVALNEQRRWGGQLGRVLVDLNMVAEEHLVAALSKQLNLPAVNLDAVDISNEALDLVPGDMCERHSMIPLRVEGKFLDVAMASPTNLGVIDELRIRTQLNVRSHLAGPKMIERALAKYYGRGGDQYSVGFNAGEMMSIGNELDIEDASVNESYSAYQDADGPAAAAAAAGRLGIYSDDEQRAEIVALQTRISKLESLVSRDEDVLRKLLGLMVEKGVASREEILEKLNN